MCTRPLITTEASPRLLRVALIVLVILGVFAMHNLLVSADHHAQSHHEMPSVSQTVTGTAHAGATVMTVAVAAGSDGMQTAMSDCGGLMALCLALVLGVGAYVVLRSRLAERVLWQLPPRTSVRPFGVVPPFQARSPLERSSILRC